MTAEELLDEMAAAALDCQGCEGLSLVGGAVRDQQLGHSLTELRDLDFVVEGSALQLGKLLVARHGGELSSHDRFGTATWLGPLWPTAVDLVTARSELYPAAGELPVVKAASIYDDLQRRDFTINSVALRIAPGDRELLDPSGGLEDLSKGILRIHHPGSFHDDATRILRLARLAVRLDLRVHEDTAGPLVKALADGSFDQVSGDRLWAEWLLLCAEPNPVAVLAWMRDRGIAEALVPGMASSSLRVLERGLAASSTSRRWTPLQCLASILSGADPQLAAQRFGLQGLAATKLRRLVSVPLDLLGPLLEGPTDDLLEDLLCYSDEQERSLLMAADPATIGPVLRYEEHVLTLPPLLSGADLLAAGMEQGQALGEALRLTRAGQLRGELFSAREALDALGLG
jgi:tRNA nucleotidyltransferase (CCA-adding enzyme)